MTWRSFEIDTFVEYNCVAVKFCIALFTVRVLTDKTFIGFSTVIVLKSSIPIWLFTVLNPGF